MVFRDDDKVVKTGSQKGYLKDILGSSTLLKNLKDLDFFGENAYIVFNSMFTNIPMENTEKS